MQQRRYLNPSQPQTLVIAVMLLYLNAAFGLLWMLLGAMAFTWWAVAIVFGQAMAGVGIANERKWGYALGIAMSLLPFALRWYFQGDPLGDNLINLMFEIALVALLLHPQSREYQRIWFK
ncbi:MAG: hypothetical protein M3179_06460 [Actinomycetota bacterium]|nr:hypothetical protein [Actinomycetota bacterium]